MAFATAKEFAAAIKSYCKANSLTLTTLATQIGRPVGTVEDWMYRGLKSPEAQERVMRDFPWLFSAIPASVSAKQAEPLVGGCSYSNHPIECQLLMKLELARQGVVLLSDILQWFVNASPKERERFRDELGQVWKKFLELTRAMTGERALELALQEGRVKIDGNS